MSKTEPSYVMTMFVFGRRRDVELEADLALAGRLVVNLPKHTKLKGKHRQMVEDVVRYLMKAAKSGQMPDDALSYGWPHPRPPNADAIEGNGDLMRSWASSCQTIEVRSTPVTREAPPRVLRQLGFRRQDR